VGTFLFAKKTLKFFEVPISYAILKKIYLVANIFKVRTLQRWAGPQLVPLCAFPQLAQQENLLRMCALIRRKLTTELRLRTKKYSCGPYFHYAQHTVEDRERERISCLFLCVTPPPPCCLPPCCAVHIFLNVSGFMELRNRFQGMNSASLSTLAGRYDNRIPTRFLAPIDCLKIPAHYIHIATACNLPDPNL
jgi:hypothetical protein